MTNSAILKYRLFNQQILRTEFTSPKEIVYHMGAMQAQDYTGALWGIGLRLPGSTRDSVEQAIADKEIIRSWAMRGTLHFVCSKDIYWMLQLFGQKIIKASSSRYKRLGIDRALIIKSNDLLSKVTGDGNQPARNDIRRIFMEQKIPVNDFRFNFLLQRAVYDQLICQGPRKNKDFTFVSLPDWVPEKKSLSPEESMGELCLRYFNSHGPATLYDFSWWSGLNLTECKQSIESVKNKLTGITIKNQVYWIPQDMEIPGSLNMKTILLPGFDEYMLGYKDRLHVIDPENIKHVYGSNGIFANTYLLNGRIAGIWKRTIVKDHIRIEFRHFQDTSEQIQQKLEKLSGKYMSFIGNL